MHNQTESLNFLGESILKLEVFLLQPIKSIHTTLQLLESLKMLFFLSTLQNLEISSLVWVLGFTSNQKLMIV